MSDSPVVMPTWPDYLKPATAAAVLNLSESAFRAIYPALVARHGLRLVGLCGPKFSRDNLVSVVWKLAEKGLDIRIDQKAGAVFIGNEGFPMRSSRSGKSGRGRPARQPVPAGEAATAAGTTGSEIPP